MQLTDKENQKVLQTARDSEIEAAEAPLAKKIILNRRLRRRMRGFRHGAFTKELTAHYAEKRLEAATLTKRQEAQVLVGIPPNGDTVIDEATVPDNSLKNKAKRRRQAA